MLQPDNCSGSTLVLVVTKVLGIFISNSIMPMARSCSLSYLYISVAVFTFTAIYKMLVS